MTPGIWSTGGPEQPQVLPVLPSVEALSSMDDGRLLAELEICRMMEKLARLRTLVARAHALVTTDDDPAADSKKLASPT
jgi:hypothetical protein